MFCLIERKNVDPCCGEGPRRDTTSFSSFSLYFFEVWGTPFGMKLVAWMRQGAWTAILVVEDAMLAEGWIGEQVVACRRRHIQVFWGGGGGRLQMGEIFFEKEKGVGSRKGNQTTLLQRNHSGLINSHPRFSAFISFCFVFSHILLRSWYLDACFNCLTC